MLCLVIRSSVHLESAVFRLRPALLNVFLNKEATSLYLRMQWITENSNTEKCRSIKRRAIDSRTI
jgi:hypothetical protein